MSIPVTCANGHVLRVKDSFAGKTGYCPHCRVKVHVPYPQEFREDDIMSVLGPPPPAPKGESESDDEAYVHQEPQHARSAEESGTDWQGPPYSGAARCAHPATSPRHSRFPSARGAERL